MSFGDESRGRSPAKRRAVLEGIGVAVGFMLVGAVASFGLWRSSVASLRAQLDDELVRLASSARDLWIPNCTHRFVIRASSTASRTCGPSSRCGDFAITRPA
jgi:hypothetical protein